MVTVGAPGAAGELSLSYYLLPAGNVVGAVPPSARCYVEQAAALQAELRQVGPSLRSSAGRLAVQERYDDQHPEGAGVEVLAGGNGGAGGGPGDAYAGTTTELERSGLTGAAVPLGATTIVSGIVPDGVATVTLHYPPAANAGKVAPAFTVTEHPIKNVFVASLPRPFGVSSPDKINLAHTQRPRDQDHSHDKLGELKMSRDRNWARSARRTSARGTAIAIALTLALVAAEG